MKETNREAVNELTRHFAYFIDEISNNLYYDRTFSSVVVGITDKGKYIILKDGQEYIVSNATNLDFKVGQSVWVKIPSGIMEDMHICGVSKRR